jgi:chromosome segregation ATPase
VISFGSTIGGGIWAASQFFAQLNEQSEAVVEASAKADALVARFEDLKEQSNGRLQAMEVSLSNMEQAIATADVENLQGKLTELGTNLEQIMKAQGELLDIRDRIASAEKTVGESEIRVNSKLESLETLDVRLQRFERDMDDVWTAIDAVNPLGGG